MRAQLDKALAEGQQAAAAAERALAERDARLEEADSRCKQLAADAARTSLELAGLRDELRKACDTAAVER